MSEADPPPVSDVAVPDVQAIWLEAAVKNMADGLCMFDADERLVICNEQYARIYELPADLLKPGTLHDDIVAYRLSHGMQWPGGAEAFVRRNNARLAGKEVGVETVELRSGRVVQVRHQPMRDGGWVATHTDITDLRNSQNELKLQNLRFDAALNNMSQGLSMFDGARKLVVSNERFAQIYHLPQSLLVPGTPFEEVLSHLKSRQGNHAGGADTAIRTLADGNTPASDVAETADGQIISIFNRPIADGGWVSTHEDITEQRSKEARIRHLARHDALTGLPNRRVLGEALEKAIARADRGSGGFAVLSVDLDRFKPVNDVHGHAAGDAVLCEIANRLREVVRKSDTLARFGGDEFGVILEPGSSDMDSSQAAAHLAKRIIDRVQEPISVFEKRVEVGASVGIAQCPTDGSDSEALLRAADMAMYRAKQDGRGRYCFFQQSMEMDLLAQATLEEDVRQAVAREEICPQYQPLVKLAENRLAGFEILARWRHPLRGDVPPDTFIPVVERLGLIGQLTYSLLRRACLDARRWPPEITIALNVSPMHFGDPLLPVKLFAILSETAFPPSRLEVEVTETALVSDLPAARAALGALQAVGIKISLDDFGTGYSSLYHLRELRFDKIKIDRSFVTSMSDDPERAKIVLSVLALAKSLGMPTIAEGIEHLQTMKELTQGGAEYGQGFYFGKAMPAREADRLVQNATTSLASSTAA